MRINFEDETIEKWCEVPMKTERDPYHGQWVRSHVKFLRAGDRFRCRDRVLDDDATEPTVFMATSDPFIHSETTEHKIRNILGYTNTKPTETVFWTINVVIQK
jgi:hypothetical protein